MVLKKKSRVAFTLSPARHTRASWAVRKVMILKKKSRVAFTLSLARHTRASWGRENKIKNLNLIKSTTDLVKISLLRHGCSSACLRKRY